MKRYLDAIGAALCFTSLGIAYFFMEKYLLLEPCPLCILDRLVVLAIGFFFVLGFFLEHGHKALWFGNVTMLILGFVFAGRHIILQNSPPAEDGTCLANSDAAKGLIEIVRRAFGGEGDCGAIYWEFLGISIPEQVLILFIAFALLLIAQGILVFRR